MSVTLINKSGRMKIFTLPHVEFCKAKRRCACLPVPGDVTRRIASSLTIPADGQVEDLPQAVLAVAKIAQAVRAGDLLVKRGRRNRKGRTETDSDSKKTKRSKK